MADSGRPSRRGFLLGGAAGSAALAARGLHEVAPAGASAHAPGHTTGSRGHGGHGGGVEGATFRRGDTVDHEANGFHPSEVLRDFDSGTTSRLRDGRVLREWEVFASDKDIEVAPGVHFPAWTFNSRVPGPTLRCTEGDRLRVHFTNGSAHPHTMHFHGIHPQDPVVRVQQHRRLQPGSATGRPGCTTSQGVSRGVPASGSPLGRQRSAERRRSGSRRARAGRTVQTR
jgi:FtsP/CotA-like multicopper oxidase with cupredoxin domain